MRWYRGNWYWVGGIVALAALAYTAARWNDLSTIERLLFLNFALLPLHELEEYGWPGGEPAIMNRVLQPSATPERYPLNQNSAMVVNVFAAYPFLLAAALLPHQTWLGLGAVIFWVGQFAVHAVMTNLRLKTIYNPGSLTMAAGVVMLVYYAYYVESNNLASIWDWVGGLAIMAAFAVVFLVKMTYDWLADERSPYPFTPAEMQRWNVEERLTHIGSRTQ